MQIVGRHDSKKQRRGQSSGTKDITGAANAGSRPGSPSPPGHPKVMQLLSDHTGHMWGQQRAAGNESNLVPYYLFFLFYLLIPASTVGSTHLVSFVPNSSWSLFPSQIYQLPPPPSVLFTLLPPLAQPTFLFSHPPYFPNLLPPASYLFFSCIASYPPLFTFLLDLFHLMP